MKLIIFMKLSSVHWHSIPATFTCFAWFDLFTILFSFFFYAILLTCSACLCCFGKFIRFFLFKPKNKAELTVTNMMSLLNHIRFDKYLRSKVPFSSLDIEFLPNSTSTIFYKIMDNKRKCCPKTLQKICASSSIIVLQKEF